ncbi:zinc finger, C2H2 type [Cooperia oncophora]
MMYSQIRLVQPKENCGVGKCRFAGKEHVHCTQRRCHFCADDDLIITNHAVVFHAGLAPPAHAEFFHIDSKCRSQQVEKPLNSSLLTTVCTECPLDGKKSHYHCIYCDKFTWGYHNSEYWCPDFNMILGCFTMAVQMCLRPFCKLKKKTLHFHCAVCDQGFSEKSKLRLHSLRHGTSVTGQG